MQPEDRNGQQRRRIVERALRGDEAGPRRLIAPPSRDGDSRTDTLKRRQAIEPAIGHMKTDGLPARNWLKGSEGDAIHAVLCGAGHNLRLILAHLRVLVLALIGMMRYAGNSVTTVWHAVAATLGAAALLPDPARTC